MGRADPRLIRIWMLSLVPEGRYGRWVSGALILVGGFLFFSVALYLRLRQLESGNWYFSAWSVAAFFVCSVAYIVPVFHYITDRTQQTLDSLRRFASGSAPSLEVDVRDRSLSWTVRTLSVGIGLWLVQSWFLAGGLNGMLYELTANPIRFALAVGPLPVWVTMCVAMSALFRNAVLFRSVSRELDIRILEPDSYMPIGTMAVTSTLVVLGALGLLSIMWLGGPVNWWTTLPALAFFSPLVILLLLVPVLPVHRQLKQQRAQAVADAQEALRQAQQGSVEARAAALSLRREVSRLPTWPFDVPAITRFVSYAIIVPLTWAGAALIEILVNAVVS